MRPGYALYLHRFAPFSGRPAATTAVEIAHLIVGRTSALVAAMFFAVVLAAQAQESVDEAALPPWSEPTLPSSESAPPTQAASLPSASEPLPSTSAEPLPSSSAPLPSTPAEPLPSSSAPLPSSEEAFPPSSDPWSSSTNYTTAQTSVIGSPAAGGPYGGFSTKNIAMGEGPSSSEPRRFHYGFEFSVRGVWDDNIFLTHTNKTSDYYFAIEPLLTLGFGDIQGQSRSYLRLDYMPSAILYVNHSDEDAFNQLIRLEGGYNSGRLRLTLEQDVVLLQSANLNSFIDTTGLWANTDANAPARTNIFNTRLRAQYDLTGKVFLQGEFDSYTYFYPNNISDYTVSGGLYIYYNWLPKVSVGVGGTFGYNWVDDPTPNQTFEQVNLRLNYEVTAKMGLYASGGVEFRQFDGERGTYTTPVFELGLTYYPTEGSTFTLAAGNRVYNSGFEAGQDFTNAYVVGRFQQRLFHRLYFGLAGGYEYSHYFAAADNVNATRNDNYWFIEPSLDVLITRWLSAGVYYLHREDSSNGDFFSFDDNQVGVRATVRF
jgi:Putative beta-barrel porin 2